MIDGLSLAAHRDIRGGIGRDCVDCDERDNLEVVVGTIRGAGLLLTLPINATRPV